jgi:hypothetical protein
MQLTFIAFYFNQILHLFSGEDEVPELDTLFNKDIEWFMLKASPTDRDAYLRYRNDLMRSIEKGDSGQEVKEELLVRLRRLKMSNKQATRGPTNTQPAPGSSRVGNQPQGSRPNPPASNPPAPKPSNGKQPVSPSPPKRTPMDQPWSKVASKPKPQQQPTRPQQPQPQLQPPEGMNLGQKLNWYAQHDMDMPEPKGKGKAPAQGPNAPRHAGEPRNIVLHSKKTLYRKFESSKFPWPAYPFNQNDLFTKVKYEIDTHRPAKDSEGRPRRKDPSTGPDYIPVLDQDENIRPCYFVYMTKGPCPYPDNNQCLANHNVERDQLEWLIRVRDWPHRMANHMIKNSMLNTPSDMKPQNRMELFPPADQLTGPIPKGTLTAAEIEEWRRAHRILPKAKGNEQPPPRPIGPQGIAWAEGVQRGDAAYMKAQAAENARTNASASNAEVAAFLAKANPPAQPRTSDPAYPTPALNASVHASSSSTKSSKLAARHARQSGGGNPE